MDTKRIIDKVGELPSLPMVASRITSEMKKDSLTAKGLARILSEDASLSAKVLRLSNSAFYGMQKNVTSVDKAVTILGFNTVKNLALSVSIYSFFSKGKELSINVEGLWHHSLGCAVSSQLIMEKNNRQMADDAFLFGIIHDIGKVILINTNLSDMEKVIKVMSETGATQQEAENEIFGFTHQKIGALVIKEWNFPDSLIAGVKLHHELPPPTKKFDHKTGQLVKALCVGNQMTKALSLGQSTNPKRQGIPTAMWKMLGYKREEMQSLSARIKKRYNKILEAWTG